MFIREIKKKNKGYDKVFISHRLMESYRSERGPRQRTILQLGNLELPKEHWKLLADRIEALVYGQSSWVRVPEQVEQLARHYANTIIHNGFLSVPSQASAKRESPRFENVALTSLENTQCRTIGAEYVAWSMVKALGLERLFRQFGWNASQIQVALLAIVGRLVRPGSERQTRVWAQELSGLDELLGTDFRHLSHNALYRIADRLLEHKPAIEEHLQSRERDLFSLQERIILYDLTNTYLEGSACENPKAKRGRSKDKRKDRPLVALGLVIDELGFPKTSEILKGNISEPGTLLEMLTRLQKDNGKTPACLRAQESLSGRNGITVVLDAGIASEENLKLLNSKGYDYVCVARNHPIDRSEITADELVTIKEDKANKIEVSLCKGKDEHILYCKSFAKGKKEAAIQSLFQERFEQGLEQIKASLSKKGGTKRYDKVLLRLGRLKEKYASIAQYYRIEVSQKAGKATSLKWSFEKIDKAEQRFSGSYFLRTTRRDLDEKSLWSLYIMLTNVEAAFRTLKSELKLRPIYHRKESRTDAHVFITVVAYHVLNSIRVKLNQQGLSMRWAGVRERLSSHIRITTALTTQEGQRMYIRNSSVPEPFHRTIYTTLGLNHSPLPTKRISVKSVVPIQHLESEVVRGY
jgi:transposase